MPPTRQLRRTAVAATVLTAGLLLTPAAANAADSVPTPVCGTGLGIALVNHNPLDLGRPQGVYIVATARPGALVHRQILVCNGTPVARQLAVYPAAAGIVGGVFVPVGAGLHAKNQLTSWTGVDTPAPWSPPRSHFVVGVTIRVAANAAAGRRYGMVCAEMPPPAGTGIRLGARACIRMYVTVTR